MIYFRRTYAVLEEDNRHIYNTLFGKMISECNRYFFDQECSTLGYHHKQQLQVECLVNTVVKEKTITLVNGTKETLNRIRKKIFIQT
ncbi:hypothetical protein T4D_276 [Trichinella pseudospiralis]|uniref:Uncharacterized protein n=1 Tax=Trichinella pseudospiralis TaxID=6337 RepID=A0A0V1FPB9_TRIPS|nr:hypothetical protein T4D_276 [Trichinella pseudospiralis]